MTFRIGRKYAQHSYPENRRAAALALFARNFATGPKVNTAIGIGGVQVPWNSVDAPVGIVTPTPDVPITPRTTGIIFISGAVTVANSSGSPISGIIVNVQVDGNIVLVPSSLRTPLADGETITIPIFVEVDVPVEATANIEILVDGNGAELVADASSIEIQEVSVATG